MPPVLAGKFLTTGTPGKSISNVDSQWTVWLAHISASKASQGLGLFSTNCVPCSKCLKLQKSFSRRGREASGLSRVRSRLCKAEPGSGSARWHTS